MANSYIEYTSGLTATTYDVPFNVLSITDVNVKGYNGTTWSDLTVSSRDAVAKTITLSGAPSAFQKIRVWRNTGTTQLVDFQNGSRLSESDLDTAYQQGLFVAQEVSENASTGALAVGETGAQGATGAAGADGISTAPFNPVAVTGATPSLNVGSYNFFDQGVLTANTTVSFASVPTTARWTYTAKGALLASAAYDITSAAYESSLNIGTKELNPRGVEFSTDGIFLYVIGSAGKDVNQYTLSTAWDVSTATFTRVFSISAQENDPTGVDFKTDGTEMYIIGKAGDDVNQYTLSTAWDVSTASYTRAFSVAAQETDLTGIDFKTDGTEMYLCGDAGDDVNQYTLSTAWDISSATFTRVFSVAAKDTSPSDVKFRSDGLGMFVLGAATDAVYHYTLSTAWDISSATFTRVFSVGSLASAPEGLAFNADGTRMYIIGTSTDSIYQYRTAPYATLTLPASVVGTPNVVNTVQRVTYDFFTMDGGTTVNLIGEEIV
jgi:sugar lactone lactonase YvrE